MSKKQIMQEIAGYRGPVILLTAVKEDLFPLFFDGKEPGFREIAGKLGWTERGTEIVLNALCALGYLEKKGDRYGIAPLYQQVFNASEYPLLKERLLHHWRLLNRWIHLDQVVKTGKPVGETDEDKVKANHDNFILSMAHGEKTHLPAMLQAVSLENCRHLLDLGGGPGLFAIGFAEKYPGLRATVFDTPETEPIARRFFEASPARNRLDFKAGNFLTDPLGSGYDAALLSSILHIYNEAQNLNLLKKVYESLEDGGKIIIREFLLNRKKTAPLDAALFAVNMLVNTENGNAYSAEEIKSWLRATGFKKIQRAGQRKTIDLLVAYK
ncbi:MAG: methyltransferase [Calditrichia bacterium]